MKSNHMATEIWRVFFYYVAMGEEKLNPTLKSAYSTWANVEYSAPLGEIGSIVSTGVFNCRIHDADQWKIVQKPRIATVFTFIYKLSRQVIDVEKLSGQLIDLDNLL